MKRIEDLRVGDLVLTKDDGPQPLRWISSRHVSAEMLAAHPNMRPIRIRAGALGEGLPLRDLIVSPQHRMLVRSKVAERMFGEEEVLVAAKHLLELDGVDVARGYG
uniref:CAZy families GT4 protein n=1 Tax=uncultured Gluconobacter sp. TaxID=563853 RepID=A0A060C7W9_9PROT|nr:CAZy families GT4 protein [uncultured Gluconobacter sp.]